MALEPMSKPSKSRLAPNSDPMSKDNSGRTFILDLG
jgi:hypothetical protein